MDKPRICEVLGDEFEKICEAVHNEWWEEKKRQGIDDHPDMLPYQELPENVKEYDRVTVRRVWRHWASSIHASPTSPSRRWNQQR